jgi:hypothetical protein
LIIIPPLHSLVHIHKNWEREKVVRNGMSTLTSPLLSSRQIFQSREKRDCLCRPVLDDAERQQNKTKETDKRHTGTSK